LNKGQKMPFNANCAATQFKRGGEPHNTRFAGHERATKDGFIMISVERRNPHTGYKRHYVLKHKYLWEKANGPLPKDTCLKCLDSNRQNCDPANWEAIPRGMLPRLNSHNGRGYDQAPAALKPLILLTTKLEHTVKMRGDLG
jgi:hypothetical protein